MRAAHAYHKFNTGYDEIINFDIKKIRYACYARIP